MIQHRNKIGEKVHPAKLTEKVSYSKILIYRNIGVKMLVSAFSLRKSSFFSYLVILLKRHLCS